MPSQHFWLDTRTGKLVRSRRSAAESSSLVCCVRSDPERFGFVSKAAAQLQALPRQPDIADYPDWVLSRISADWVAVSVTPNAIAFGSRQTARHLRAIQAAIRRLPARKTVWLETLDGNVVAAGVDRTLALQASNWGALQRFGQVRLGEKWKGFRFSAQVVGIGPGRIEVELARDSASCGGSYEPLYQFSITPRQFHRLVRSEHMVRSWRPAQRRRAQRVKKAIEDAARLTERIVNTSDPDVRARLLHDLEDAMMLLHNDGEEEHDHIMTVDPVSKDRLNDPYRISRGGSEYRDRLPGGIGDKTTPEDVDPEQLRKGIEVEMEHTTDRMLATEIALDHLTEDPEYYTKLATIEPQHAEPTDIALDERKFTYIEGDELVREMAAVADRLLELGELGLGDEMLSWIATARGA